ncbi:MAG TPA: APC family permease [Ktedonobacteraceae bacterium]|nr:APC family permease [Ktedonobacteraceae bacterium]
MSEIVKGDSGAQEPVPSTIAITTTEDTALRKDALGLSEVLFQSITAMAPAAAVATALSPAVGFAGASLPLAVLLATIACAFIAASIGQLAIHIPSAGGMYTYISQAMGAKIGFLSAWTFLLAQPLLLPLVALIWGPYAEDLFKLLTGVDIPWYLWTILGIILVFALTYYGIKLSADASVILGAIEIVIILSLSFTMIFVSSQSNTLSVFTPVHSVLGGLGGWVGIFQGMIFAFLAFVGFETAAPLGEETHNPKRNIPRAVVYSAIGIGLLYTLASYAGMIGWGIPKIAGYAASAAPWADLATRYWGTVGPVIVSFAILNSAVGNGNAGINATTRVAYAMGRIGTLPSFFARLSKHRTPSFGIMFHTTMALVVSIGCGLIFGVANAFGLIGTILTLGLVLLYIASCVASFTYYRSKRPQDFRIVQHVIVPTIPLIILLFVVAAQVYPVPPYPLNLAVPILIVWILIGVGYMMYLARTKPAALERGKDVYLKDLETEPTDLARTLL